MERHEYDQMHALEGRLWWYLGLHRLLVDQVQAAVGRDVGPLLDAGCGTGGLLAALGRSRPASRHLGVEYDADAARLAARKSSATVVIGSVTTLPFADATLGAIVSADVLSHGLVDPALALKEAHRCLESGGILILNLPAYPWMLSAHDRQVHNVRRFVRGRARALVEEAGFSVRRTSYWNCFLFPLMVARRVLLRNTGSDVQALPAPVNALFAAIVGLERRLIGWGLSLPFGGSVLLVAQKGGTKGS
ncbi:class I SAM-dependent methyltransferase [Reyranella sp. CPCC 100927]|uniref:class I SAM-dependent methyltransferase n=1 Tax=Reyranella sp. CPCC 100927 TaxID=2599616 RepID=UPI001C49ADDC|nr:class I SAM-dependent methyltransferase [Reyranella sp. CPCC 100927]